MEHDPARTWMEKCDGENTNGAVGDVGNEEQISGTMTQRKF